MNQQTALQRTEENDPTWAYPEELRETLVDYTRTPQFKRLMHRLANAQEEHGFRTLAVLSQLPGEGKSFLTSVLALGFARMLHRRVLIFDAVNQTRNRSLMFNCVMGEHQPDLPLGELHEAKRWEQPGYVDFISTLSMGQDNLEASDFKISYYIDSIKSRYDLILVDTCAVETAGKENLDPFILAKHAEAALLVTTPDSLGQQALRKLKRELARLRVELVGTIHNGGLR